MSNMKRSIGIRQGRGDKISFKFLHNVDNELIAVSKTNKDNKIKVQRFNGATVQRQNRFASTESIPRTKSWGVRGGLITMQLFVKRNNIDYFYV